ncbi:MAG: GYD domain-containing protein [Gemmatimonadales bacterium]
MPTYISLLRYTQQGIANIKQGPSRLDAARQAYKKAGGELKAFYLTIGQYDAVAIADLPDDMALAKMALALGAQGNVRTETMRAFNETEFRKIVGDLP